jgi:hypothetical protein
VSQWKVLLEKTGAMGEMDVMERTVAEDAEGLVDLREEEGELDLQVLGAQKDHKVLRAIALQTPIIYGR